MSLLLDDPTPPTPEQNAVASIKIHYTDGLNQLVNTYMAIYNLLNKNADSLTKDQILAALGADAAGLTTFHSNLKAYILSIDPTALDGFSL